MNTRHKGTRHTSAGFDTAVKTRPCYERACCELAWLLWPRCSTKVHGAVARWIRDDLAVVTIANTYGVTPARVASNIETVLMRCSPERPPTRVVPS